MSELRPIPPYNPALVAVLTDTLSGEPVPAMTAAGFVSYTERDGINPGSARNCFYDMVRTFAMHDVERYYITSEGYTPETRNSQTGLRVSAAPDIAEQINDSDFTSKRRNYTEQTFVHFKHFVDAVLSPPKATN